VNSNLNLASKPFSNRILPWALTAIILFVSLIGLIVVVRLTTNARREGDLVEAEYNQLKQREHRLLESAQQLQQQLTPEQQQALPSAHELVDRKTFSWSRLLSDLESSLPQNVRVSRIEVTDVNRQADQTVAQLGLTVFAKDAATINEMITEMHRHGVFNAEVRIQNLQKGRGEQGTEYELAVIYRAPSHYTSSENVAEVDETRKGAEVADERRTKN
jgi:hypothetical protein